jgi:hypothetical protein
MQFVFPTPDRPYDGSLEHLKTKLAREFPNTPSVPRRRFVMAVNLAEKVMQQQKCTTIRYDRDAVEYPAEAVLPLFAVTDAGRPEHPHCLADLRILSVRYASVDDLTETDALYDGFSSLDELMGALQHFYGHMMPHETVCIYEFALASAPFKCPSEVRSSTLASATV